MSKEQAELIVLALWKIAEQMEQQTEALNNIEHHLKESL